MFRGVAFLALTGVLLLSSCAKKETAEAPKPGEEAPAAAQQPASGPHAVVRLQDGTKVPGSIVASSKTDMVVAGDDGIERKIPLAQVKSVEYGDAPAAEPARRATRQPGPPAAPPSRQTAVDTARQAAPPPETTRAPAPAVTTRTYVVPTGAEISVRTNEPIDSATATEGQTFDVQVTRDVTDANGDVVIPRGAGGRVVIRSASQGGRIRGASDLTLDLQSVTINGRPYAVETADVTRKGKSGVGANKRTAEYTGGGAALGAIIGAIAGGGKGAAIGAGAGAGAGALTQVLTKGRNIKVPVESVLTFKLDMPLKVTAV